MLDPYRMIAVNIIASMLLLGVLVLFKHFFPKKKINFLYLLISISFLPVISILRKGAYESGDFVDHVKATMQFYVSLSDGISIPQLSNFNCNGFTCPDFIFHYLSPHYIMSLFHFLGFSFIASEKIFLISVFILSGITMYYWLKEEIGDRAAFVGSIFYLFAPYHLVDLHFRTDVGELLCFVILPLALYFGSKMISSSKTRYFIGLTFSISILILSHQVLSLSSIPVIIIYIAIKWYQKKKKDLSDLIHYLFSVFIGVFLTAFYWLPILIENKFIAWGNRGQVDLLKIQDLLYSPWRFGFLFQGHRGELSFLVGYVQIIFVFLIIYFLLKKRINKTQKPLVIFFLTSFFGLAFLMTTFSSSIWSHFPLLNFFGFSYRLMFFECLFTAFMAGVITTLIKNNKIIGLFCAIAIFSTILNWGNRKVLPEINDVSIMHELTTQNTGLNNITLPIWVKGDYYYKSGRMHENIDFLGGDADIKEIKRTINKHEYLIDSKKLSLFRENTFYFPGWNLYVNNEPYHISNNFTLWKGTMVFVLPKGLFNVEFKFEDTKDRSLSKLISVITFILFTFSLTISEIAKKTTKKRRNN